MQGAGHVKLRICKLCTIFYHMCVMNFLGPAGSKTIKICAVVDVPYTSLVTKLTCLHYVLCLERLCICSDFL